jgi:hypothetical protein
MLNQIYGRIPVRYGAVFWWKSSRHYWESRDTGNVEASVTDTESPGSGMNFFRFPYLGSGMRNGRIRDKTSRIRTGLGLKILQIMFTLVYNFSLSLMMNSRYCFVALLPVYLYWLPSDRPDTITLHSQSAPLYRYRLSRRGEGSL